MNSKRWLLAGALLIVHAPPFEGPIVAATLAILAVMIVGLRAGIAEAGTLRPVIAAGMALNGYTLLTDRCPSVWVLLDRATRDVTSTLGGLSGSETSLGPSVAGIPVLTLVFAYLAARFIDSRRGGRTAVGLSLLWVVVLAVVGWSLGVTLILRALDAGLDLGAFFVVIPGDELNGLKLMISRIEFGNLIERRQPC